MNRRGFLQALGTGAIALAVPGQRPHEWMADKYICTRCGCSQLEVEDGLVPLHCAGVSRRIFLPPRRPIMSRYLTSNTAWFIKTEHQEGLKYFRRELSEEALEQMCIEIRERTSGTITLRPTRLIVHPSWTPEAIEKRLAELL